MLAIFFWSPPLKVRGGWGSYETMDVIDHNSSQPPLHLKRRGLKEN